MQTSPRGGGSRWYGARRTPVGELTPRDFTAGVLGLVERQMPPEIGRCRTATRWRLAQIHFGDPAIHYEVWLHARTERIEIGLHLEGARDRNAAWLRVLDERLVEIKAGLGPEFELEPWDRGWVRLYRTLPPQPLTPELVERVAEQLASLIAVVQPIVQEEAATVAEERA